jgi:hypothetical protein
MSDSKRCPTFAAMVCGKRGGFFRWNQLRADAFPARRDETQTPVVLSYAPSFLSASPEYFRTVARNVLAAGGGGTCPDNICWKGRMLL